MNGYLLSIIGTVLLCSVITAILPNGKTATIIKGIAKLVCILAIVAPVLRFFRTGEITEISTENSNTFFSQTGIDADRDFIKYYSEMRIRETESALEKEIEERYAIATKVKLLWETEAEMVYGLYDSERIRILEISVQCAEEIDGEVKTDMWTYLTENYCSEVLIE